MEDEVAIIAAAACRLVRGVSLMAYFVIQFRRKFSMVSGRMMFVGSIDQLESRWGSVMTDVEAMVRCQACGELVAPARMCQQCGALLRSGQPVVIPGSAFPRLLTVSAVDFLNGDEQAFAYLCSLAIRAATGEISDALQAELDVVARDASADATLGDAGAAYVKSLSNGSPDWYSSLRRLRSRLLKDDRVDLLTFAVSTTNYEGVDVRTGPGHRRVDAVLDAMHSDLSAIDWQADFESLYMRFAPGSVDPATSSWLPLAKKVAPAISIGAMMLGHPWVSLAIDAAGAVAPDGQEMAPPDFSSEFEMAQQLALAGALIFLTKEVDPEKSSELLSSVPELISFARSGSDAAAVVLAEFLAWLKESSLEIPRSNVQLDGYLLPHARVILDSCGWKIETQGRNGDGSSATIWQETNWRVSQASFGGDTATLIARKS